MAGYLIADTFTVGGTGTNGIPVAAYDVARFSAAPVQNSALPDGSPADAAATTAASFGADGAFQLTVPTLDNYWVVATSGGVRYWKEYTAAAAAAVTTEAARAAAAEVAAQASADANTCLAWVGGN